MNASISSALARWRRPGPPTQVLKPSGAERCQRRTGLTVSPEAERTAVQRFLNG